MTTSIFARAKKLTIAIADRINGNARRRRAIKVRAMAALLCGKRPALVRAEVAARHSLGHHPQLQARIELARTQIRQRLDWHRNP